MEHFQRLDENIANLVIGHGFLNLDTLQFATDEEVENAATLALQMAGPDVQLAIAMQQSGIPGGRRPPPNLYEIPGDPIPRQYITWEERNRLLADSRPNSAATSESDEANENNEQNCIVCSGGRQPKSRLPCGARAGISSATSAAATGEDDVLGGADSIHRKETTASRYANGARYTVRDKTRTSFPRLPDPIQPLPMGGFQMMDRPNMEDMDRADRIRQGRGRYSIFMYHADGSNTQPEMRRWRSSRRAYRRRPQEGARAWPTFEIQPDDPLCNHHLPMSWVAEDMNNRAEPPQCGFCRSRDEAIYFRCAEGS
ncbi:IBR domain-containing protein [Colletotrichum tabaci]|uniref:IBR domain-containing protein n=1 Tax=Colletotrichum tabaci TaxID=1209068 RepID=A0AAV9T6N5_9PEZI